MITAAETAAALPPLDQAFRQEVEALNAAESSGETKTTDASTSKDSKPETKAEVKTEAKPEEVKTEQKPEVKAEVKKKSALDAAMSDDTPDPAPVDEVQQLIESKDPNWNKARETMKKQSEDLKALREAAAKTPAVPEQYASELKSLKEETERLRTENKQYKDAVVALDVKYDPEFQAKYVQGREKLLTKAAAKVEAAGADKKAFLEAMELKGPKRAVALREVMSTIETDYERGSVTEYLGKIDNLEDEADEHLSKPQESFEEIRRKREVQQREQQEESIRFRDATFESVQKELPKVSKLMRLAPADSEGAEQFNEQLQQDIQKAPALIELSDPREIAVQAYKAARYDTVEKMFIEQRTKDQAQIEELQAELSKYEGADPAFRGGGKAKGKADYEVPLDQAFRQAMAGSAA